jgi:hypothetical protein
MIPCNATVDVDKEPTAISFGRYRVEVWGRQPHDYVRVYTINASSDTLAAQEGIRRFSDEISLLLSAEE